MRLTLLVTAVVAFAAPTFAAEVVPVPQFRSVELRGGVALTVVPGPVERVTIVDGSSQFTHMRVDADGKLKIDTCDERCPRTYRLRVEIQSPTVPDLAISGGGAIETQGRFRVGADNALAGVAALSPGDPEPFTAVSGRPSRPSRASGSVSHC